MQVVNQEILTHCFLGLHSGIYDGSIEILGKLSAVLHFACYIRISLEDDNDIILLQLVEIQMNLLYKEVNDWHALKDVML